MDWITIDRGSSISLTDQLFYQIRDAVLSGVLPGGSKLPPTRQLSLNTGVSRNIVVLVYEQLIAESYIQTIKGRGTYVSKNILFNKKDMPEETHADTDSEKEQHHEKIDFRGGIPDLSLFPIKQWVNTYKKICYYSSEEIFNYPNPMGEIKLRNELSRYLFRSRGLATRPENIIITGGSSSNFTIISDVLNKHRRIVMEDPFFSPIRIHFLSQGKEIVPVRVDNLGLIVDLIPDTQFDFIVTTPSHQYPLAVTLSAQRRIELIKYVENKDSYILEDDYDSEFRYKGNRISSLFSLSPGRVIYSGTFSKSISPALRIGFMIVPPALLGPVRDYVFSRFLCVNKIEQFALAEFIKNGSLERNLFTKKKTYGKKFSYLKESIYNLFDDEVSIQTNNSGLHLILYFKKYRFNKDDLEQLNQNGLIEETVALHAVNPMEDDHSKIIIAFSNISHEDLLKGLNIIKKLIDERRSSLPDTSLKDA